MIITSKQSESKDRNVRVRAMSTEHGPDFRIKLEIGDITVYMAADDAAFLSKMIGAAVDDALRSNDISATEHNLESIKRTYAELG